MKTLILILFSLRFADVLSQTEFSRPNIFHDNNIGKIFLMRTINNTYNFPIKDLEELFLQCLSKYYGDRQLKEFELQLKNIIDSFNNEIHEKDRKFAFLQIQYNNIVDSFQKKQDSLQKINSKLAAEAEQLLKYIDNNIRSLTIIEPFMEIDSNNYGEPENYKIKITRLKSILDLCIIFPEKNKMRRVFLNKRYGFIDKTDNFLKYKENSDGYIIFIYADDFFFGKAVVRFDLSYYYIDKQGEKVSSYFDFASGYKYKSSINCTETGITFYKSMFIPWKKVIGTNYINISYWFGSRKYILQDNKDFFNITNSKGKVILGGLSMIQQFPGHTYSIAKKGNEFLLLDKNAGIMKSKIINKFHFDPNHLAIILNYDKDNKIQYYSLMDTNGNALTRHICKIIYPFQGGYYLTKCENSRFNYLNKYGKYIGDCDYDTGFAFFHNRAIVIKKGRFGLINGEGQEIIRFEYDTIFREQGYTKLFKVGRNGKFCTIDINGNVVSDPDKIYLK